jgi:hypothetical protein
MIRSRSWEISAWKPNDSVAMVLEDGWVKVGEVEEDAGSAKKNGQTARPSYKVLRR